MAEIKLIDQFTDLSNLKKPIGWDLVVRGVPFDVYRVDGYNHTIGGKWGENCYWTCPAGEKPTFENMIEFNGDAPTWGITFDRNNYIKHKYGETSVECNGTCWITRNGEKFYPIPARFMDYGLAKAQYYLVKLQEECPLWLSERNWKESAINRKVWYENQPGVITSIDEECRLWIIPDGIEKFEAPASWKADGYDYEDYENGLWVDLLSEEIDWYRD